MTVFTTDMKAIMRLKIRLMYAAGLVYWRLFKPLTMGVRLLLVQNGKVMLVKHSYQAGWFLPGGGVRRKESLEEAARREAWEELGARLGELHFFGLYSNFSQHKSDHIVVYACDAMEIRGTSDHEIEAVRLFPLNELPDDLTPGSRRRVEEYIGNSHQPGVAKW